MRTTLITLFSLSVSCVAAQAYTTDIPLSEKVQRILVDPDIEEEIQRGFIESASDKNIIEEQRNFEGFQTPVTMGDEKKNDWPEKESK